VVVNGILDMSQDGIRQFRNFAGAVRAAGAPAMLNCCNLLALKARESAIDLVTRAGRMICLISPAIRARSKQIVLKPRRQLP